MFNIEHPACIKLNSWDGSIVPKRGHGNRRSPALRRVSNGEASVVASRARKKIPAFNVEAFLTSADGGRRVSKFTNDHLLSRGHGGCGVLHPERQGEGLSYQSGARRRLSRSMARATSSARAA
jgi:hypothetical protein